MATLNHGPDSRLGLAAGLASASVEVGDSPLDFDLILYGVGEASFDAQGAFLIRISVLSSPKIRDGTRGGACMRRTGHVMQAYGTTV